jgi:hypothetical protein
MLYVNNKFVNVSLPRGWIQEIKRMYLVLLMHYAWFIFNLNTNNVIHNIMSFITQGSTHMHDIQAYNSSLANLPPCFLFLSSFLFPFYTS